MKIAQRLARAVAVACFFALIFIWTLIVFQSRKTADKYFVEYGNKITLGRYVDLSYEEKSVEGSTAGSATVNANLKLFSLFPIKSVTVTPTERKTVVPGGIAFGIKMVNANVIVATLNSFVCDGEIVCPAKNAGIKIGDLILSINSMPMQSNDEVVKTVIKSQGKPLAIKIKRNDKTQTVTVTPKMDSSNKCYKLGLSVRDSSAGIGTVTFYNPNDQTFGGLGHAVCDPAFEETLSLYRGSVAIAEIDSVTRGAAGTPGRLNGHFVSATNSGEITVNNETGVYGTLQNVKSNSQAVEVAFKQEVEHGKATILTTVDGTSAEEFEIEIEQISPSTERLVKNMVIHVTDERLLSISGGIVQGMSGSPILQNGRLVGAVTHVFVNDPTRGYAIFAENMLESAQDVSKQNLKSAS